MIKHTAFEEQQMRLALSEAQKAFDEGEIPIGAVIFDKDGNVLVSEHNRQIQRADSLAHAEVLALAEATTKTNDRYLNDMTLVVTLEPCVMCAGAIAHSRLKRVIFAAWDDKAGAVGSVYDVLRDTRLPYPKPEVVVGVLEAESQRLLRDFFELLR